MAATTEPKRKPGWMSIPGGPKEPNGAEFRTKFTALIEEKKNCFESLKAIRAEFDAARGPSTDKTGVDRERTDLREKISKIDKERKDQRDQRRSADERIKEVRENRRGIEIQLKQVLEDVGAFESVQEIDKAIELVMYKMETGTASIKAEKETIKRLNKLEEAKGLLEQLEPLEEAIAEFEERELDLRQESREIHAKIAELNEDYEKSLKLKIEKDKERTKNTFDFTSLHKRRETVSAKIDELNKKIDELKANFEKSQAAWNDWRVEAQQKFQAKMEAERAERERVWKEREEARRLERRRTRAAKKLNPHKVEIEICATLIAYLKQKVVFQQREQEEAEKRAKLASFDAKTFAPKGAAVASNKDDDWLFSDRSKKPAAKKAPTTEAKAQPVSKDAQKKAVHHTDDKKNAFGQVQVEAPATFGAIDAAITALVAKKKEFESKIILNPDDVELSSEEEADGEVADDTTIVASTAAPAS